MAEEQEAIESEDSTPVMFEGLPVSRREFMGIVGAGAAATALMTPGVVSALAHSKADIPADPKSKKTIVQAMGLDIDQLDPHYFKSIPGYYAMCNLYDMMLDYQFVRQADGGLYPAQDSKGNWKMKPWVATSWKVSKDQKTITFNIRGGLKFSDGKPLTAKDVKAAWDRAAGVAGYGQLIMGLITIDKSSQITAPNDHTVVLHLHKPNPFAMKMLSVNVLGVINDHAVHAHASKADPIGHSWLKSHAAGSAPYVLANWTPGVSWELKPNKHYWNAGAVKNSGTLIRTIPSAAERYNLLVKGDIDVAYDLSKKDLAALRHSSNVRLVQFKVPWPYYLGMNNTLAPFDNVKVRQAIAYSIPTKTIIDKVLYGFGKPCKSPVAAGMPTSDFRLSPYTTNPSKAKRILQQAGVSNLKFDLAVIQGRPEDAQIAVWIQASLAQAGVEVRIVQMTASEYFDKQGKKQLQAFIAEFYSWVNDPFYHLFWNFHSKNTITNATGYHNAKVNSMIDAGMYETNIAKRTKLSHQIQKTVIHDAPWALLYQAIYTIAVRKNIHDFNWYPDVGTRFWKVYKS